MRHHLAGDQPVEHHSHGRELLFYGRGGVALLHEFNIAGHVIGPDGWQGQAARLAPGQKVPTGAGIGPAGVRVADVGSEEFCIAPACLLTQIGNQGRDQLPINLQDRDILTNDNRQVVHGILRCRTRKSRTVMILVPSKSLSASRSRLSPVTRKSAEPEAAIANR